MCSIPPMDHKTSNNPFLSQTIYPNLSLILLSFLYFFLKKLILPFFPVLSQVHTCIHELIPCLKKKQRKFNCFCIFWAKLMKLFVLISILINIPRRKQQKPQLFPILTTQIYRSDTFYSNPPLDNPYPTTTTQQDRKHSPL